MKAHENRQQFRGLDRGGTDRLAKAQCLVNTMKDAVRRFSGDGRDVDREVSLEAVEQSSIRLEALLAGDPSPRRPSGVFMRSSWSASLRR